MTASACGSQSGMLTRVSTPMMSRSSGPVMSAPGDGAGAADGVGTADGADEADGEAEARPADGPVPECRVTATAMPPPSSSTAITAPVIHQPILSVRTAETVEDVHRLLNGSRPRMVKQGQQALAALRAQTVQVPADRGAVLVARRAAAHRIATRIATAFHRSGRPSYRT